MTEWPSLPLESWRATYATLHRYMQIVGKVQLALTPLVNHFWNAAFHLTERGLTTRPIPHRDGSFEMEFDLLAHTLAIRTGDGAARSLPLDGRAVADFYRDLLELLQALGIQVRIWDHPVEIPAEAIPFQEDRLHAAYDAESVGRCFTILTRSALVLQEFRAGFIGKCSPVHFFWGSFDLAVSRFSGRRAPVTPGADSITREAYSHEVSSVGFWPGDARYAEPVYYAYHVPAPPGFAEVPPRPEGALWHPGMGEFLLPYEAVRRSASPRQMLLDFAHSAYVAGAELAGWNRAELERPAAAEVLPSVGPSSVEPRAGQ